jgi:hypothetical protein
VTPTRIDVSVDVFVTEDPAHGRREDVAAEIRRALERRLAPARPAGRDRAPAPPAYADRIAAALVRRIGP